MKRILAAILFLIVSLTSLFSLPSEASREGRGGSFEGVFGSSSLVFNEVMQSNIDVLMVENDFPDSWAELYNTTSQVINVRDWRIGLTRDFATAYRLPSAEVPAGGYLTVLCDKENRALHTDFRIDSGKGSLFLFDASGTVVDSLTMKKMPAPNVAYGRTSDGTGEWYYEFTPTPGAANAGGGAMTVLPTPIFNIKGGLYDDYDMIIISRPDPTDDDIGIFFTFDGSEPTRKSNGSREAYISLSDTKVVRARLISLSGKALPSPVVTHSYIYHPRKTTLPVISIVTDERYFNDPEIGILSANVQDNVPNYMRKWRRPLNIEYFSNPNSSLSTPHSSPVEVNQLAETAVSGVSTREQIQKSLKIYANKRFGEKAFNGAFWPDKPQVTKSKSFILRSGGNNAESSRINDAVVQRLFGTHYEHLDWQAYQPVIVYLNGKYYGEYGMRERSDEDYVEANHGISDVEMADETSYAQPAAGSLFSEFYNAYHRKGVTYSDLASMMDVDNFIEAMVAEVYGRNTDYPTNNVSMWTQVSPLGGDSEGASWRWILKDMDRFGMQLPLYPRSYDMIRYLFSPDDLMYGGMKHFDLYKKMMQFPEVRNRFIDLMTVSLGDFLRPELVNAMVDSMANDIAEEVRATFKKYNISYSDFTSGLQYLKRDISDRPTYLYNQMADYFHLGTVFPLTVKTNGTPVSINGVPLTEGDYRGAYFTNRELILTINSTANPQVSPRGDLEGARWLITATGNGAPQTLTLTGTTVTVPLSQLSLTATSTLTIELIDDTATGIVEFRSEKPGIRNYDFLLPNHILITKGKKYIVR